MRCECSVRIAAPYFSDWKINVEQQAGQAQGSKTRLAPPSYILQPFYAPALCCDTEQPACDTTANHDKPGWKFPKHQCNKRDQRQSEVMRAINGTGPYRLIQCGQQQAHDGDIDAGQRGTGTLMVTQSLPERQNTDYQKKRWRKNCQQANQPGDPCSRSGVHGRA